MVAVAADQGSATRLGRWLGRVLRVAMALLLLGGLLGSALTAARRESLTALSDDLAAGRVSEVTFTDGTGLLPVNLERDDPEPAVRWMVIGSGWRTAALTGEFTDGGAGVGADDGTGDGTGIASAQDPEQRIRDRVRAAGVPVTTGTLPAPRLLLGLSVAAAIALVLVLIGGPQPRLATKWAWFWLMLVPGGLTQLLWLAIEAPWSVLVNRLPEPRPHRQQPGDTRFTGGYSFLLSLALSAAVGWVGWRVAGWLAG